MTSYTFVKKADKVQLDAELKKSSIAGALSALTVLGTVITVDMVRPLSASERSALTKVIVDHTVKSDSEKFIQSKISSAIQFGQQFMIEVATDNVLMGLNTSQILRMLQKYGHIQGMMLSGSLHTALAAIEAIEPDDIVSPARKALYVSKIKKYLGLS